MSSKYNIKVIDSMMGNGKSSAAINYINESTDDEKFLVIVPFLNEVHRYKESCPKKHFKEPKLSTGKGKKINSLKMWLGKGENIVSTHSLFQKFDNAVIDILRLHNYTLILDEVADVISPYKLNDIDVMPFINSYVAVDKETDVLKWTAGMPKTNNDKFADERRLCELQSLIWHKNKFLMKLFPCQVFAAFKQVFIMTYMFEAQLQCYYYKYNGVEYTYGYIEGNNIDNYRFTDMPMIYKPKYDYSKLIHILDDDKMNKIGDLYYDLGKNWFKRNLKIDQTENPVIVQLQKNIENFFKNKTCTASNLNIWTTFKDYRQRLKGDGYTKGFLPVNSRAENRYSNRTSIAYIANRFLPPEYEMFFDSKNIKVDEDAFALSEMLQFIWRSAIRNGQEIQIYMPSARMRTLLQEWIKENSL